METLHFCRDGVLRRTFSRYDRNAGKHHFYLVPLRAYERVVDNHVFLKSLSSTIEFEDGLTVGELMENLAPWAETMIGVGVLDFPAFLEEVRREPARLVDDVEKISLFYHASLKAVPRWTSPQPGELFGMPKASGKLTLEARWGMDALLTEAGQKEYDGATSVAIDYTPMSEWKHLPIVIEEDGTFDDETVSGLEQDYIGIKQPVTDASYPLVEEVRASHGGIFRHRLPIEAPSPRFFDCLVLGFLWEVGFSFSPAQRDEQIEKLKTSMAQIDNGEVEVVPFPDGKFTQEDTEEATDETDELDRKDDEEFALKTAWLDLIEKACWKLDLPPPREE